MAPTSAGGDDKRRYFADKAAEAKRLKLYKHGRTSLGLRRDESDTLMQYRAEGATNAELADIFGYKAASCVSMIVKRERERGWGSSGQGDGHRSKSVPRAATKFKKQQPTRKVEIERAQGETSFGFKVEEQDEGVFVVTGVRVRGPAALAGLSVGDQVAKFKLLSPDQVGWKPSAEAYKDWSSNTLNDIEEHSQAHAIRIATVSPKKPEGTGVTQSKTRRSASMPKQKTPNSSHLGKRDRERSEGEDEDGAESTGEASGNASSDGSEWSAAKVRASTKLPASKTTAKSTTAEKTGVSFRHGPNKRVMHCVRLDGEDTLGFSVDQPVGDRFRVSHVEERGSAARAGVAVGHWLVSFNLTPIKPSSNKPSKNARVFESWTESSLEKVNAHPANHVIAIKLVAPDGFSRECIARMDYIQHAKRLIGGSRVRTGHDARLSQTVIQYDQRMLTGGVASDPDHDSNANGPDAQATAARLASQDGTASNNHSDAKTKYPSAISAAVTADAASKTASPTAVKRRKPEPTPFSFRVGCKVEFVQAGMPLANAHGSFLTPTLVESIQKSELTSDAVAFFLLKMAQLVPYQRLRVLPPAFYQSAVLQFKLVEWKPFIGPDAPVVCLPVFDSGRWVLVVVVSTEKRVIAHYLDCQNPDGFLLPVSSRIMQYIDAAYDELSTKSTKPLVVSKPTQTSPTTQSSDSGVFVVSYFAAIVRKLVEHGAERSGLGQGISAASLDRIFSRDRLEQEAKATWTDAMKPRLCWGTVVPDKCRPYLKLNLRKSTIEPTVVPVDAQVEEDVAIVDLLEEDPEVVWLSEKKLLAFDTIQRSELVSKLGLAREEADKLAEFYD